MKLKELLDVLEIKTKLEVVITNYQERKELQPPFCLTQLDNYDVVFLGVKDNKLKILLEVFDDEIYKN